MNRYIWLILFVVTIGLAVAAFRLRSGSPDSATTTVDHSGTATRPLDASKELIEDSTDGLPAKSTAQKSLTGNAESLDAEPELRTGGPLDVDPVEPVQNHAPTARPESSQNLTAQAPAAQHVPVAPTPQDSEMPAAPTNAMNPTNAPANSATDLTMPPAPSNAPAPTAPADAFSAGGQAANTVPPNGGMDPKAPPSGSEYSAANDAYGNEPVAPPPSQNTYQNSLGGQDSADNFDGPPTPPNNPDTANNENYGEPPPPPPPTGEEYVPPMAPAEDENL